MGKSSIKKLDFPLPSLITRGCFGITVEASRRSHPFAANTCTYVPGNQIIKAYQGLIFGPCISVSLLLLGSHLGTHKKPPNMALDEVMLVMLMINDNNRCPHNHYNDYQSFLSLSLLL